MKMSKIYTRTGDKGTTSLVGGVRVSKADARLEAYGTIDELNACIGWLMAVSPDEQSNELLKTVQHKLFSIGSYLATDQSKTELCIESKVADSNILRLEQEIDEMHTYLPELSGFILLGGSQAAAACHVCRTVCRRAERRIYALEEMGVEEIDDNVKRFVNRLSDYLFVLSRKLNYLTKSDEIYWDKTCE